MLRNRDKLIMRFGKWLDVKRHWQIAMDMGRGEKNWLDGIKVMSYEELLTERPWDDYPMNGKIGGVAGVR